jgi:hypothetical protein
MNINPNALAYFTGTESYTYGPFRKFVMTDGVTYLCNHGCAWFVDLIASHQSADLRKKSDGFQVWRLEQCNDKKAMARASCEDGNRNMLLEQKIEFTDFPFDVLPNGLTVYVEEGSINGRDLVWVAMLSSER